MPYRLASTRRHHRALCRFDHIGHAGELRCIDNKRAGELERLAFGNARGDRDRRCFPDPRHGRGPARGGSSCSRQSPAVGEQARAKYRSRPPQRPCPAGSANNSAVKASPVSPARHSAGSGRKAGPDGLRLIENPVAIGVALARDGSCAGWRQRPSEVGDQHPDIEAERPDRRRIPGSIARASSS